MAWRRGRGGGGGGGVGLPSVDDEACVVVVVATLLRATTVWSVGGSGSVGVCAVVRVPVSGVYDMVWWVGLRCWGDSEGGQAASFTGLLRGGICAGTAAGRRCGCGLRRDPKSVQTWNCGNARRQ